MKELLKKMKFFNLILIFSLVLASCTVIKKDVRNKYKKKYQVQEVIPKKEKYSKYGNPKSYKVFGIKYMNQLLEELLD